MTGQSRSKSMASFELLRGAELIRLGAAAAGKVTGFDALRKPYVALYFSASWCPPCQGFTPKLAQFYEKAQAQGLEVVWVSSDDNAEQFKAYQAKMGPWLAVPFEDVALRARLKQHYGVCAAKEQAAVGVKDRKRGIPTLAVIRPDGSAITLDGDEEVEKKGLDALKGWEA